MSRQYMGIKLRSPDQTAISVSISKTLLDAVDARAKVLGMNRSQYLNQLIRRDVSQGGDLTVWAGVPSNYPINPAVSSFAAEAISGGADELAAATKPPLIPVIPPVAPVNYRPEAKKRSKRRPKQP